jgi:hypothetical protein
MSRAQVLNELNHRRFYPALPTDDWRNQLRRDCEDMDRELAWVESLREQVRPKARSAPRDATAFVEWFEQLKLSGPGQNDPLFPWLETEATREQLRWFIFQEVAGEAGFEDLVALTQLKLDERCKLELARNYWDEMGRGKPIGMHGPMLGRTAAELEIGSYDAEHVEPALDLANLLSALAFHRRYAYHSIGALGAVELTAPTRTPYVARALKRAGVSPEGCQYFVLHSGVDIHHSIAWNAEILTPLVSSNPELAMPIAEGALMRLEAGARCFDAYRAHFNAHGVVFEPR